MYGCPDLLRLRPLASELRLPAEFLLGLAKRRAIPSLEVPGTEIRLYNRAAVEEALARLAAVPAEVAIGCND